MDLNEAAIRFIMEDNKLVNLINSPTCKQIVLLLLFLIKSIQELQSGVQTFKGIRLKKRLSL